MTLKDFLEVYSSYDEICVKVEKCVKGEILYKEVWGYCEDFFKCYSELLNNEVIDIYLVGSYLEIHIEEN
jgi:hypothetical protein